MKIKVTNLESSVFLINNPTITTAREPFQTLFVGGEANRPFNLVMDISEAIDTDDRCIITNIF